MPFSRSEKREVRSEKRLARRRAFTLVEIMIVVVIIGLMAGIITYATTGMLDKAKHKRAISDISTLVGAVDMYHGDRDKYPTNQEGLAVLVPQYIKVLQKDPW